MQKPPPDFRTNFEATHPPILIDNGLAILENEKIERHIMKSVPGGHNLFVQDKEVASLIENLYSKLKLVLVRKDEQKSASLRAHLSRIDGLLERRGTSFLALWRYMYHMYQLDAFTQSCPADQDIINHYKLQQLSAKGLVLSPTLTRQKKEDSSNTALKMKKHEELETPTFTTSIPVDVSEVSSAE
ncbi:Chloride intracellular channel isoform 1 [Operophtera brumata]|uniref:Chloride intracellular channel isoform 1 n=1 Tax=Operophtera brumata TaxID=104452 RepID=A0A0L7KMV6_OPEBR|nr:Chloride intracellular channel isoform 1 [Operophtera brumata]